MTLCRGVGVARDRWRGTLQRCAMLRALRLTWVLVAGGGSLLASDAWWPANDETKFQRTGAWTWASHRYAAEFALVTREDGAALEFTCEARTAVLGLDTLTPPNHYGPPE